MKLEICTASVDDCITAQRGSADRVELNTALALGGLTPSAGMIREAVKAVSIPVIVMIRPRDGGFCYSNSEFKTMQRDIDLALGVGAAGIAFGILLENGRIDRKRNKTILDQLKNTTAVMHRAFDLTPDPFTALDTCIDLGFNRILTSGQQETALKGAVVLKQLILQSKNRIEILPGSGITPATVESLVQQTGCQQVHCSLSALGTDLSAIGSGKIDFRSNTRLPLEGFKATDYAKVHEMSKRVSLL